MSLILCIETATETCSVALSSDGHCLEELTLSDDMRHSSALTPMIQDIMKRSQKSFEDLSAVCISNGPGSYTGLRVGSSTAKAICYSHSLPLIAISSLQSIAYGIIQENPLNQNSLLIPTIDARRMEVYMIIYDHNLKVVSETTNHIYTQESIDSLAATYPNQDIVICGHGASKLSDSSITTPESFRIIPSLCNAKNLCLLAFNKFNLGQFESIAYHKPHYYKAPNITIPKSKV